MASAFDLAQRHQERVSMVADRAIARALVQWRRMNFQDLDQSWNALGPSIVGLATAAQLSATQTSTAYLASASTLYGNPATADSVNATSFAGIDGSGRSIDGLLQGSVIATKQSIGAGLSEAQSMLSGATYLAAMLKTAIHDVSRSADLTAQASHGYTTYVRVVQSGACSRCAILAGISSGKKAFSRHPACKCSTYPVQHDTDTAPAGLHDSPDAYFDSLSKEQQDKVFTKDGAEAVRSGASIQSVVSGRRGASGIQYGNAITRRNAPGTRMTRTVIGHRPDGSAILGYTTTEGNTVRGEFGRIQTRIGVGSKKVTGNRYSAVKRTRLMPESIIPLTDDPELRRVLLRDAGYIDYTPTRAEMNAPLGGGFAARREAIAREDRATADEFYRKLGIQLG